MFKSETKQKRVKTQIYIDQDILNDVKYLAAKKHIPYSELIRDAVAEYLPKMRKKISKKKKFDWAEEAKKYATDMGGIAQHIDDELYT